MFIEAHRREVYICWPAINLGQFYKYLF